MAKKPELKQAVAYNKIKATDYNTNFNTLLDYIEDISEELTLKVNTINSQLSSNVLSSLQSVYPVGSLYIGTTDTCPIANLFGTWEKIEEGLCLQSVKGDQVAGTTVEAGLPNITGTFDYYSVLGDASGAFTRTAYGIGNPGGGGNGRTGQVTLNASNSSSIYKDDCNTVQPPAYVVNIWKRTA